jgi:hypothetical protein
MTDENWLHALNLETYSQRKRYYGHLRRIENKDKSRKKKQQLRQQQLEEESEAKSAEEEGTQRLPKNTIFMRVYDATVKKVHM